MHRLKKNEPASVKGEEEKNAVVGNRRERDFPIAEGQDRGRNEIEATRHVEGNEAGPKK